MLKLLTKRLNSAPCDPRKEEEKKKKFTFCCFLKISGLTVGGKKKNGHIDYAGGAQRHFDMENSLKQQYDLANREFKDYQFTHIYKFTKCDMNSFLKKNVDMLLFLTQIYECSKICKIDESSTEILPCKIEKTLELLKSKLLNVNDNYVVQTLKKLFQTPYPIKVDQVSDALICNYFLCEAKVQVIIDLLNIWLLCIFWISDHILSV